MITKQTIVTESDTSVGDKNHNLLHIVLHALYLCSQREKWNTIVNLYYFFLMPLVKQNWHNYFSLS